MELIFQQRDSSREVSMFPFNDTSNWFSSIALRKGIEGVNGEKFPNLPSSIKHNCRNPRQYFPSENIVLSLFFMSNQTKTLCLGWQEHSESHLHAGSITIGPIKILYDKEKGYIQTSSSSFKTRPFRVCIILCNWEKASSESGNWKNWNQSTWQRALLTEMNLLFGSIGYTPIQIPHFENVPLLFRYWKHTITIHKSHQYSITYRFSPFINFCGPNCPCLLSSPPTHFVLLSRCGGGIVGARCSWFHYTYRHHRAYHVSGWTWLGARASKRRKGARAPPQCVRMTTTFACGSAHLLANTKAPCFLRWAFALRWLFMLLDLVASTDHGGASRTITRLTRCRRCGFNYGHHVLGRCGMRAEVACCCCD